MAANGIERVHPAGSGQRPSLVVLPGGALEADDPMPRRTPRLLRLRRALAWCMAALGEAGRDWSGSPYLD